ncbi:alpha-1,2-fucosyltransferase [Chitinophaga barathri]|uniref:Alpha-1,2-fucosyltransferase n=1 Tax=Chitinophaga barathri TaxID=1647451 RepID=A0A3N4MDA7_9BACT|nr:alpha-1,2-fucosyltransferase [Chitinophaga barathri]
MKGGLGNQMFQYAAGRCLSVMNKVPLALDKGSYEPRQADMYGLGGLNVDALEATPEMIPQPGFIGKVINRLAPVPMRRIFKESSLEFDPLFFKVKPPVYLKGYWQSWKYFEPVKHLIRQDFQFSIRFSENIMAKAAELRSKESVAVHFRRGDYTNSEAASFHGACGPAYYEEAVKRFPGATFCIFTNDPAWVKDNLPAGISYEILSGSLTHTQYEDLFLMSQCRHQVIANSSFSWWAAWLNDYEGRQVVAPLKWYATEELNVHNLVPSDWQRI